MNQILRPLACLFWLTFGLFSVEAQNPIVTENALPGNPPSEWDLPNPDAGDLSIQGFAVGLSVNKGETVRFKIDVTGPATNYTIKIYRLGWYNGDGARLIVDLGTFAGVAQPAPATDAVTGLVDCGTWAESASWAVPTSAVSGVYIAKLTRLDNNGASHIAFIVRDDAGDADLLFKTSDATWQAYNGYGGNSLYTGSVPGFPSGHAAKVSYNRPFLTRSGGAGGGAQEDWVFNSEYPMIRFLERNGYDVSYTTDLDMERDPNPIDTDHKVILSVGHDEYWSAAERTKFENARNAGVHLAFFSGNEVYWQTRWENSIDGNNDPVRTLVCYKEGTLGENTCGDKCDPNPNVWTGLWRDGCAFTPPANGCNPENALTGQISWDGTTTEIKVPDTYKNLRFWRNTSIASLGIGQTATLTAGSLGYEWDWEQYPESYPRGRILMSSTTFNGHTHKLSLYRHSSGAYVFGAGTVQWAWGLDAAHDRGGSPADPAIQQATINLFADMGVQPATLMSGMVAATASTDVTPPSSVITTPLDGATFPNGSNVTISGTATDVDGVVAGVEVSVDGGTTWRVANGTTNWTYNWVPTAEAVYVIKSRAFDDTGNMETPGAPPGDDAITVEISGSLPCPCTLFQPSDVPATPLLNDGQPLVLGMKFRALEDGYITKVRFYKDAGNTGTHIGQLWTGTGTLLAQVTFVNETASGWQEEAFATPVAITANTTYVISYHSSAGNYSVTNPFFTSAYVNGPLRGLANGEDGPNGVYKYSATPVFPDDNYQSSNYWVDVVFETSIGPDVTPPTVSSTSPTNGASGVSVNANITAIFSEAIDPATVGGSTVELLDGSNAAVPAAISYNAGTRTATIDPTAALNYSETYTARIVGGSTDPRIKDLTGNALAADYTWTFTTAAPPPPPPSEGPGGPILVVSAAANPFSRYPVEMLRAEGFNEFFALDISQVDATVLNNYDVVILGEMTLSPTEVTMFSDWVDDGGTFIAFRPDAQLATLLGLTPAGGTLSEGYLLVNTASGPGIGIVNQTIQFHGTADQYNLNGATSLATLYSNANTATTYPAVTMREVGANSGKAVAFTYDLARSIVLTRQGNPAWEGQNRETTDGVIRSNDLFYGNASGDPQPDWVNLDKVAIPQADEQMRLLSNIIALGNLHRKPLPRFWFLPSGFKAAVVMTGDDHGVGLTSSFFDDFIALSGANNTPADVTNWTAVRGSSYIYPNTPLPGADTYESQGFEVSIHVNTGCGVWTPASLASDFSTQLATFAGSFPNINPPATHRTHCIAWSDFDTKPQVELANGIRLDVNYYYWPGSWVLDRPGMFTGSGLPMRFADASGNLIDVYQVATQFTDESGQNFPSHHESVIDKATGPEGYYGVFCANFHTDRQSSRALAADLINYAKTKNVPTVSAKQMLDWLDGRNGSSFGSISWASNALNFNVNVGANANNLRGMVPVVSSVGTLLTITRNGNPVTYTTEVIKGINYAFFPAEAGAYIATYGVDNTPPVITNVTATPDPNGTEATVTWNTDEAANSLVEYGTAPNSLTSSASASALVTSHSLLLTGLIPGTTYYYRVTSEDASSNAATEPNPPAAPLSFSMPVGPCAEDQTATNFNLGTPDANTLVVSQGDGAIILKPFLNEEFSGNAIPAGWSAANWNVGGSSTVGSGSVTVDGAHVYSNSSFAVGTSIEFVATYTSGSFQNVAFSNDADFNAPWIGIGQGASPDGNLYARNSDNQNVSLGALLGTPHRFKIKWNATNFEFFVDGSATPNATINMTVGTPMYLQISDFNTGGGTVSVDWLRATPYAASGSYTSRVFDQGAPNGWGALNWTATVPANTSLSVSARTGNTPAPDGSWTAFVPVANGGTVGGSARYLQYRVDLATTDNVWTPLLDGITVECGSGPDVTPPVITNVAAAPDANGTEATVTWNTDEPANSLVEYGTAPNALTLSESASVLVTSHSLLLTGLIPGTTYYYRVTSEDGNANSTTEPNPPAAPLSITMPYPPCFVDASVSDFGQGTLSNTYRSLYSDGVILKPTAASEFTTLPPVGEWASFPWTGGTSTVSGGILSVDGARYNSEPEALTFGPGATLEFVATFGAASFQHIGFGGGDNSVVSGGIYTGQSPWAMFSTHNTTTTVKARTFNGSTSVDFDFGGAALIGTSHLYRIEWKAASVDYYVDNVLVRSEPMVVGGTMRPAVSDFNNGGPVVQVDWIHTTPYLTPGSFESRVYDAGALRDWQEATWTAATPVGTSLQIFQRQGNTPTPDGTWTAFSLIPSNGAVVGGTSRYIQYRADFSTTDLAKTPLLTAIQFACSEPATPTFEGTVKWHHDGTSGVQNATVNLTGDDTGSDVTDANGDFSIAADATGDFVITPVKNTNKLNGVTVADAVAIQQHIANQVPITNPYRYVGADVNKSNSITTQDANIINQSLLGNPAALAQFKTSWRFTPTSHTMEIPPWGFPEKIILNGVGGGPQPGNNFYGIKTGDIVTTYANPANFGVTTMPGLVFNVEDQILEEQKEIVAEFKANQLDDLTAFQFVLRFDSEKLELAEVQPLAALPLTADNFGTFNIADGEIRAVWSQATSAFLEEAAPVFYLKFKVLQGGGQLSEALYLDESVLAAYVYNSDLAESGVTLDFYETTKTEEQPGTSGLYLFQNRPNPFSGQTAIGFVLPESCEAQLRIFDVSGRALAEKKAQYPAGRNEETFDLQGALGVLWYELTTPFGVLTKKMVAVEK